MSIHLNKTNYVDKAEEVIKLLRVRNKNGKYMIKITTSKIRNLLSMVTELYNDVIHIPNDELDEEMVQKIQYLRLRIVYEAGRDPSVKEFIQKSGILNMVQQIGNKKSTFLLFVNYMEALVAYHRFYSEEDK